MCFSKEMVWQSLAMWDLQRLCSPEPTHCPPVSGMLTAMLRDMHMRVNTGLNPACHLATLAASCFSHTQLTLLQWLCFLAQSVIMWRQACIHAHCNSLDTRLLSRAHDSEGYECGCCRGTWDFCSPEMLQGMPHPSKASSSFSCLHLLETALAWLSGAHGFCIG